MEKGGAHFSNVSGGTGLDIADGTPIAKKYKKHIYGILRVSIFPLLEAIKP